jgi:hypothetical protein
MALLTLLLGLSPAHAACTQPYTSGQLAADLGDVQSALRTMDDAVFDAAGHRLEAGLPCLSAAVPVQLHAAAYRYLGAWYWIIPGNTTAARGWFRTSLELDPNYAWDVDELDINNPMREAWDAEKAAALATPTATDGKIFAANGPTGPLALSSVADAQVLVDGRVTPTPTATAGRPHIVQYISGKGPGGQPLVAQTWQTDGATFPTQLLMDPPPVVADVDTHGKKSKGTSVPVAPSNEVTAQGYNVVEVRRERPPAKTPLLLVGVGTMLAAGGVYGLAYESHGEFGSADTTDEVYALQKRSNLLVIASGGVLALGLGVGGWGVLIDGGAAFGLTSPF